MKKLLPKYLAPYKFSLLVVVILVAIQALSNLYLPNLNADIINNGVVKGDTGYIYRTGGFMLLVTGLLGVCSIVAVYFGSRTAMRFGRDVRSAIFRKVMDFSQKDTNTFGTPSLITRNTNDVQQVQMVLVMAFNIMIMAPIMMVGGIIMALREDVPLSGLLLIIIPLIVGMIAIVATKALPMFRSVQKKTDRINQVMRETLSGVRVIRAFVRTEHEEIRFDEANADLTRTQLRVNRLFAVMIPFLFGTMNLSTVAIVWFGGLRIDSGDMQIGNLSAFLQSEFRRSWRPTSTSATPRIRLRFPTRRASWSSTTSNSAIPARRNRSCAASASRRAQARPRPSSAARDPARQPSPT
jgi:ATP-binding cassette subfamily B protein